MPSGGGQPAEATADDEGQSADIGTGANFNRPEIKYLVARTLVKIMSVTAGGEVG